MTGKILYGTLAGLAISLNGTFTPDSRCSR